MWRGADTICVAPCQGRMNRRWRVGPTRVPPALIHFAGFFVSIGAPAPVQCASVSGKLVHRLIGPGRGIPGRARAPSRPLRILAGGEMVREPHLNFDELLAPVPGDEPPG